MPYLALIALLLSINAPAAPATLICHKVNGRGNTGVGYNLIDVPEPAVHVHDRHPGDLIPAPNGLCLTVVPPPTTRPRPPTTTEPPVTAPPTTRPPNVPPATPPPGTTVPPGTPSTVSPGGTTTTVPGLTGTLPPTR